MFNLITLALCFPLRAGEDLSSVNQRIISLGPAITEQLYLLGVQERLVGCTIFCKRPKEAENKEKVGTVIEINLEKVVSLSPDLVLATPLTDFRYVEKLKKIGIKVVRFPLAGDFNQLSIQFLELGEIVGRKQKAEEIVIVARKEVERIKEAVECFPKRTVFVQVGANPLFTVNEDSFVHDFIKLAGGINVAGRVKSGFYSREKVLNDNPEVIIIATMGIIGEEEKGIWQKYKTIKAVKNNRIYIIDSYALCSPTPVSFVETLKEMQKYFIRN
ncbi:ABC transporter substrate-binding protein [bacterium]|nr:ABC transporter substrate-binding protein [bacterium]